MSFQILGTGSFAPEKIVTNDDLSHMVETSDEWMSAASAPQRPPQTWVWRRPSALWKTPG